MVDFVDGISTYRLVSLQSPSLSLMQTRSLVRLSFSSADVFKEKGIHKVKRHHHLGYFFSSSFGGSGLGSGSLNCEFFNNFIFDVPKTETYALWLLVITRTHRFPCSATSLSTDLV